MKREKDKREGRIETKQTVGVEWKREKERERERERERVCVFT